MGISNFQESNEDKGETETNENVKLIAQLQSEIEKCHLETSRYSAELEASTEKINCLESKLLQAQFESQRYSDSPDDAQKLIEAKDRELTCLQEALDKEKSLNEINQVDFESKLKFLEESLSIEKKSKIEENLEKEKNVSCLNELLLSRDEEIKKQGECIAKMNMHVEEIQKQVDEKQIVLENYNSKIIELENEVESYKKLVDEKSSESEINKIDHKKIMDLMKEEILRKEKECSMAETMIMELSSELQVAKENSADLINLKQQFSELCSKVESLELENSSLYEKIGSLEREHDNLIKDKSGELNNQRILDLETQVEKLQKELLEKENLLKSDTETRVLLESELQLLTSEAEKHKTTVENIEILKKEKNKLQSDVHQRDEAAQKQCAEIVNLSSQVSELQNELRAVTNEKLDVVCVIDKVKQQLRESEEKIKSFEAVHLSNVQIEQDLRQQVTSLQSILSGKDKLIQDLEQEVAKVTKGNDTLKNKIHQKGEAIKIISIDNSTQVTDLKDGLDSTISDKKSDVVCVIDEMKKQVRESEDKIKNLEAEHMSGLQVEQELREQIICLQENLSGKDKLIQDLEQEVSKLKDVGKFNHFLSHAACLVLLGFEYSSSF